MRETGNEIALKQKTIMPKQEKNITIQHIWVTHISSDLITAIYGWPHDLAKGSREGRPVLPSHVYFFVLA